MVWIAGMAVAPNRDVVLGVALKECAAGKAGLATAAMETWALKALVTSVWKRVSFL